MTETTQAPGSEEGVLPAVTAQPDTGQETDEAVVTETATEGAPTEEPEGESQEAPPAAKQPFDAARYERDENFTAHTEGIRKTALREGHMQAIEQVRQSDTNSARLLGQIDAGIRTFNKLFKDSGLDVDALDEALNTAAPQLAAFRHFNDQQKAQIAFNGLAQPDGTVIGGTKNAVSSLMQIMAHEAGEPELGTSYAGRYLKEVDYDFGKEAVGDFVKDFARRVREKAESPLKKRISALEAQLEKGKLDSRQGGPDNAPKTGAGGKISNDYQKRLDRLSVGRDSDGNAPTAEDRAWLAAQE